MSSTVRHIFDAELVRAQGLGCRDANVEVAGAGVVASGLFFAQGVGENSAPVIIFFRERGGEGRSPSGIRKSNMKRGHEIIVINIKKKKWFCFVWKK